LWQQEIDMSEPITVIHSTEAHVVSVGGELRAAVGLLDGRAVADPFHHTAELVEMLRLTAREEVVL
jgi:hypothetical protein